jgi:hypothetical protein
MSKNLSNIAFNFCYVIISSLLIENKDRCFQLARWIIMKYIKKSDKVKNKTILTAAYIDYYDKIIEKIKTEFQN